MTRKRKKHPGFEGASESVAKREHIPLANARRIIGYNKAHASAKAKRKNPRLRKI